MTLAQIYADVVMAPARGGVTAWGFGEWMVAIVIIAAVFAVVYIATQAMGIVIPRWVLNILGVVAIAFVAIIAIRMLLAM